MTAAVSPAATGTSGGSGGDPTGPGALARARELLVHRILLVGLAGLVAVFSLANPAFLTGANLTNIALATAVIAVIAVPAALLTIAGQIDLSVGASLALGALTAGMLASGGTSLWLSLLAAVGVCAVVGMVNGYLVAYRGYSALIVTLGMLTLPRGVALTVEPNTVYDLPTSLVEIGRGTILGIPYLVLLAAAVFVLGHVFLEKTRRGRHVHAVGIDARAATAVGLPVKRLTFALYVATGVAVGLASCMFLARVGSVTPGVTGIGLELDVLTAVLLAGVAFGGGRGRIFDVLLGVLFIGVLENGLVMMNAPLGVALAAKGLALVLAAALDRIRYPNG